jgi:hypothetical protein
VTQATSVLLICPFSHPHVLQPSLQTQTVPFA